MLLQAVPGEVQARHQEEFLHWNACQTLEQTYQGSGGVFIPGSVQEMTWHLVPWFSWHGGVWSKIGSYDIGGIFQPKWLYDFYDAIFGGSLIATRSDPTAVHLCFAY